MNYPLPFTANLRRFTDLPPSDPSRVMGLADDHAAIVKGHSIFRSQVVPAEEPGRIFVSGLNNRKIGRTVMKGEWAGMPIFMLTLEERATCPRTCATWSTCYGNAMHMARRHKHGHALEMRIVDDIADLAAENPKGFVVRLHVLGDFYSTDYAMLWCQLLIDHPALHIFGYTARSGCAIASILMQMNETFADRCFIRTSAAEPAPGGAVVVTDKDQFPGVTICPAETSKTECCATCGLCWAPSFRAKPIAFLLHGNPWRGKRLPRPAAEIIMEDRDWIELSPWNLKKSDEPRVSIRAACMGKHKVPIAYVGINAQLCNQLNLDRSGKALAKIDFGTGKNEGMLRVQQSPKGRFRFAVSGKQTGDNKGVRLVLRIPNQPPSQSRQQILDHKVADGCLIISLPKEWANVVSVLPYSENSSATPISPHKEVLEKIQAAKEITTKPVPIKELKAEKPKEEIKAIPAEVVQNVHSLPAEPIQETANGPQLPQAKLNIIGRYLTVGQTPINLMADEIELAKVLMRRFGETLKKSEAEKIERDPAKPLLRLRNKLIGSPITIEGRRDGWAMANSVAA